MQDPSDIAAPAHVPERRHEKTRVHSIDYAKGVGILLVVLGHVWRGLDGRITLPPLLLENGPADRWIYGFHMAVFFFVSGLFLYRSAGNDSRKYLADKSAGILWPYLVWSVIYWKATALAGGEKLSTHDFLLTLLTNQKTHLWFLWVLLAISLVVFILRKLYVPRVGVLVFAILLWFAAKYPHRSGISIQGSWFQLAMMLPFVAVGIVIASPLMKGLAKLPIWLWVLVSIAGAVVVTWVTQSGTANGLMFNPLSGFAGIAMVLGLARVLEHDRVRVFEFLGQRSLEIYLVHILFAAAARTFLIKAGVTAWQVHLPAGLFAGVLGPLALWWVCTKMRFPYLFRLPVRA